MGTSYNSEMHNLARDAAKIQQNVDVIPTKYQETIVPTMEINPLVAKPCDILKQSSRTTTGDTTIYTTPIDRDFYLVGAEINAMNDAVSNSVQTLLKVVIGGSTINLINLRKIALTASSQEASISLNHPLKLDRDSIITLSTSFTVGVCVASASIVGFLN